MGRRNRQRLPGRTFVTGGETEEQESRVRLLSQNDREAEEAAGVLAGVPASHRATNPLMDMILSLLLLTSH